jgi:hypothetical protein
MAFPTNLTNAVDDTTDVVAAHLNNLEAKVGVDDSTVETSHDYKLSTVSGSNKAETQANKKTDLSDNSDTFYASQKAVKTAVDAKQATLVS